MTAIALPALSSDSSLSAYLQKISLLPYLEESEEKELARRWAEEEDISAAHQLVTSHLRLVAKIAMKFKNYGLPMLDLISEGNLGLMHAVKKFDLSKGFRLSTYAMWWIKASIQEYVLKSWSLVKIGTSATQKKLFFNLRKIKSRLNKVDNNALSNVEIEQIAHDMSVSKQDVMNMDSRLTQADKSLNDNVGSESDSAELIEYIEEEGSNQEVILEQKQELAMQKGLLMQAVSQLNEREQDIIKKRRLCDKATTLDDLSKIYNVSRERIRQIEERALEKISGYVKSNTISIY